MKLYGKKVLVTGAGGFIGSHLVERLVKEGCKVRAFVHYNSTNRWGWIDSFPNDLKKEIEIFTGDVRDSYGVKSALRGIEIVFHLAALIGIPFSYYSPDSYVETNVKGTLNILQASREFEIEKILITSTSEVYGTAKYVPIDENHPRQPQSPYSATKIAADAIAISFYRSFNLPAVVVRPFNTYGPRQSARAVIPTIITQLLNGQMEIKLGALHPTRDLVFVEDTVEGFVKIAKADTSVGQEINIATGKEISIKELAQKIIYTVNPKAKIIVDKIRLRPENSEVERLCGSNYKLKEITGWEPQFSLEEGLEKTIDWYRNKDNLKFYKPNIYNI